MDIIFSGIWPSGADGTDINGCAINKDKTLVASADDFGKVNLYSYPSRTPTVSDLVSAAPVQ